MAACPNCGHENADGAKFCSACGARLDATAAAPREVRKTVTIVFCDLTGSTGLGERLDPESLRTVMTRYFDRMRAVLEAHGGTVEKFIGDAVMAVFGIPAVHEDDAVRAVRAAHEMRVALGQLNADLERDRSVTLQMRIGVNTGPVVAGDPGAGQALVTGDAVNTAARLEQAAEAGEILIGEETFGLARDAIEAEHVDPLVLRGKANAVDAFRLLSVRAGVAGHERRLDSPMIGRELQLRMLLDAFEAAATEDACRLFTVMGPAGIGKSRLVREFVSAVGDRAQVLSGRCLSYGEGITFFPIAEMVIQAAGISEDDTPGRARAELSALLEWAPDGETVAAHLAGMLGLDGSGRVEAPWAVRRFLETLGGRRPVVAVFDDVHWGEPSLLEVIEHVAAWSRDVPILLVCMARPELLEERPGWGGGQRNATSVHLEPLSEPEADALIENLLGHPALTHDIRERIRAAANGNPLFVEEMLSMLVDDAILVQKDGEWVATVDLSTVQVPPAISALLASRLDRLAPLERRVVEAAAVVGEVFDRSAVAALVPDESAGRLDEHLGRLLLKDVVRPSPSDVGGEGLRFRHILLRDAAYDAIPKGERAVLHEAFADHLQAVLGDRTSEFDEFVGYHLEQAHRMRDELGLHDEHTERLSRSAFEHLRAAGVRAAERGDPPAAASLLLHAVDLRDPDDPERLEISWVLGFALADSGSIPDAAALLTDAIARAEAAGNDRAAAYARCAMATVQMLGSPEANVATIKEQAERAIAVFEAAGDDRGQALAWSAMAFAQWFEEHVEEARRSVERAIPYARAAGDRVTEGELLSLMSGCNALGPTPVTAGIAQGEAILADARATGNRRLEQSVERSVGTMYSLRGSFEQARAMISHSRGIAQELGLMIDYWAAAQNAGRNEWLAGEPGAAAEILRESCEALESMGETAFLSTHATMLAALEVERGNLAEADRWIELAERTGSPDDRATQVGIELARGLVLAARGDPSAGDRLRRAVALIDETDMSPLRIQVRCALAAWVKTRDPEEAARVIDEAVELADAKGATALVDQARRVLSSDA
ncbi:MAG TPA: adenylate/guanylate cyclase domain-containing protein [Actinomycetota bacterium]|nr:adenylate/guanylate cyclase domain-containing protein [Actinomycetota bacterium]